MTSCDLKVFILKYVFMISTFTFTDSTNMLALK